MPLHVFRCLICGKVVEDVSTAGIHICPVCGNEMIWDLSGGTDTMGDGRQFANTHWSESLAISPSQIGTHKKLFPDIPVRPDGAVGFDTVGQQKRYLEKCGFEKKPQKIR